MRQTLRKRITDLLHSKNRLNAIDLAKELDVEKRKIVDALHGLKKRGVIKPVGQIPWRYVINDELVSIPRKADINKVTGIAKKIVTTIINHKESPLDAKEIAEKVNINLSSIRYFLSTLKGKGILKAIGKQPWHYAINEDPVVPPSPITTPAPVKETTIEGIITTNYSLVIIYTLKESEEPHLMAFKASQSQAFISAFEKLQENENLATISGFKKLKCVTKVIMTPKVAE